MPKLEADLLLPAPSSGQEISLARPSSSSGAYFMACEMLFACCAQCKVLTCFVVCLGSLARAPRRT